MTYGAAMPSDRERASRARQILDDAGAVIAGDHFVYDTGRHGDGWIAKDLIFPHTELADELGSMLADACADLGGEIVCGPATGGLIVSQWTAHHLGLPSVFADHAKEQGYDPASAGSGPLRAPFVLKRGYDEAVRGKRVLLVDDVVNTGLALRETAAAVGVAGGELVAAGVLSTRGFADAGACGAPVLISLCEVVVPSWPAAECELCRRGVPVNTRYAHGADFLAQQAALHDA